MKFLKLLDHLALKVWWLNFVFPNWSETEVSVMRRIYLLTIPLYFSIFFCCIFVFQFFGVERHIGAERAFFLAFPPGLYLSRKGAEKLWPDLVRKADANAAKRYGE